MSNQFLAELSKETLLSKCLHGKTQNQNESYNALIWERLPKTKYVSLIHLKFGSYDAVSHFNIGKKNSVLIFEKLNMIPGRYLTIHDVQTLIANDFSRVNIRLVVMPVKGVKYSVELQSLVWTKMRQLREHYMKLVDFNSLFVMFYNVFMLFSLQISIF